MSFLRKVFSSVVIAFIGLPLAVAQPLEIAWQTLGDVSFEDVWDKNSEMDYQKPTFGDSVIRLDGKKIAITGYMIPVDFNLDYYVLSAFPFASCFFCGGAGPESVMNLNFVKPQRFKNDERITVCGVLRLNPSDQFSLPYALDQVEPCTVMSETVVE